MGDLLSNRDWTEHLVALDGRDASMHQILAGQTELCKSAHGFMCPNHSAHVPVWSDESLIRNTLSQWRKRTPCRAALAVRAAFDAALDATTDVPGHVQADLDDATYLVTLQFEQN